MRLSINRRKIHEFHADGEGHRGQPRKVQSYHKHEKLRKSERNAEVKLIIKILISNHLEIN